MLPLCMRARLPGRRAYLGQGQGWYARTGDQPEQISTCEFILRYYQFVYIYINPCICDTKKQYNCVQTKYIHAFKKHKHRIHQILEFEMSALYIRHTNINTDMRTGGHSNMLQRSFQNSFGKHTGCSGKIFFFHNSLQPLPRLHRCKRPTKLSTQFECTVTPIG